jgi:hypothetical protein
VAHAATLWRGTATQDDIDRWTNPMRKQAGTGKTTPLRIRSFGKQRCIVAKRANERDSKGNGTYYVFFGDSVGFSYAGTFRATRLGFVPNEKHNRVILLTQTTLGRGKADLGITFVTKEGSTPFVTSPKRIRVPASPDSPNGQLLGRLFEQTITPKELYKSLRKLK